MYYENKRSFYIKQYGPATLLIFVAIVLIVSGFIIGFKSMNSEPLVAENPNTQVENNIVDTNSYTYTEASIKGKVTKVNGLTVTVESNNSTYDINLIGIMQNDKYPNLSETIKNDLVGKDVTVDYDNVKTEEGKTYGYIFVEDTLYNKTILAKGLAELRPERQNIDMLDELLKAQIDARHNGLGIWKI